MVPVIWSATGFFLSFWAIFLPFYPTNKPKIKMLKKWRKKHLEISSFYTNVTKILIILYCSWDMVHDGFNSYFSFWAIFWLLTPLTAQKLKISQKWKKKKHLEVPSFYKSVPKIMIICYTVPEIWHVMGCNCYFSFSYTWYTWHVIVIFLMVEIYWWYLFYLEAQKSTGKVYGGN